MLKVDGIESWYGAIQALKGVTLDVKEGEIVALLGANGAGKSTTLRSISGLVPANTLIGNAVWGKALTFHNGDANNVGHALSPPASACR